jgi:hypothetical protein
LTRVWRAIPTDYNAALAVNDAGKQGAFEARPGAALAGAVLGGIAPGALAERGIGSRLGQFGRANVAGAGYGAAFGSGMDNNDRLGGAAWGGLAGGLGSVGGQAVGRGTSTALGGIQDGAVRRLAERGINLTPGQYLGQSGRVGAAFQRLENAAESIPLLGSVVRNARENSFQDFNRAAFNEGMSPIGETIGSIGTQAGDDMGAAVGRGYDRALGGQSFTPDPQLISELSIADTLGRSSRQFGQNFGDHMVNDIAPIFPGNGQFSGREFQDVRRTLGGLERQYDRLATQGANGVPAPTARVASQAFEDMGGAFDRLVQRQAPDVLPAYNAANEAYRNSQVLKDAIDRGRNGTRSGTPGVFAPSQLVDAASRNAKKFGNGAGTTRQPFHGLSQDAQEVLPSDLGNSGTFDRAASAALLGAPVIGSGVAAEQGWIDPKTALAIAAASALYSRPGMSAMRNVAAAPRPQIFNNAARSVARQQRRLGLFGSAFGVPALLPVQGP